MIEPFVGASTLRPKPDNHPDTYTLNNKCALGLRIEADRFHRRQSFCVLDRESLDRWSA